MYLSIFALNNKFLLVFTEHLKYTIILSSLYVLSNISYGKDNQKKSLSLELIQKVIEYVEHPFISIRYVSLIILNNLFINADLKSILIEDKNLMDKLEKASTEKNLDKNLIPSDLDDFKSTKVIAIELISVMKNSKKNTEQINTTNINTVVTNTNN